jgi:DNA mismatch repair protein MutS2
MHPATLRALEFDRVREALASFAVTPLGAERLATLEPQTDRSRVAASLAATTEGVRLLSDGPGLPLRAPADLEDTLEALDIQGRPLEALRLVGLADFVHSIDLSRSMIQRQTRQNLPILAGLAAQIASFDQEIAEVRRAIDPAGDVVDNASPKLRELRDKLRRSRSRLRTTLESYVRGRETARYLQDLVVTDRNGRYVLVVKSESRASIPGIVHGASSSGASLYLEPLSTVELNNDIVSLQEQEHEEVRRILLKLTDAFRAREEDLGNTLEVATELDVIQAKTRLAMLCKASAPALSSDGRLELRGARHPLLIEAVVARTHDERGTRVTRSSEPVPVDVLLLPPIRVLVITGPNTGGKTVALKCAGLLPLMAQAGLHIPAEEGSQVPVFQSVFADIGDEQSIAANLSTFSSHITNIAAMDRALVTPALVLLDEVGSGTDPMEGGALGMAIIDHFRQRGALMVATTHYDALKSYASTTPEVTAAAFGFNPDTFAPTYRLLYGSPGASLALEMSARLGLPASIVNAAREFRSERDAQLADHLAKIDRDLHALDRERTLVAQERRDLTATRTQFEAREESLREREEQARRRLESSLNVQMREARREIDAVVEDLKKRAAALAEEQKRAAAQPRLVAPARLSTGDTGSLRTDARTALEQIAARLRLQEAGRPATARQVATSSASPATARITDDALAAAMTGGESGHIGAESSSTSATAPGAPAAVETMPEPVAIVAGLKVIVGPLGLEGVVQGVQGHVAEVNVNGKRLRAHVDDLRPTPGQHMPGQGGGRGRNQRGGSNEGTSSGTSRVVVNVQANAPEGTFSDLNLVGCKVPEALDRTDKFLDQALLTEQRQVRLIHGHGTGQLRRALAEYLHDHPLVSHFALATPDQGGNGVTIVDLKD